jgi:serine phosphatase RsbU (regulator of sigma subunit)
MKVNQPHAGRRRFFRIAPMGCAAATLFVSGLTMLGWATGNSILASLRAHYIPMAPSTALCFTLIACSVLLHLARPGAFLAVRFLSGTVLAVGVGKLVEYAAGIGFGLDALLVREPEAFGSVLTGRMAPLTAANMMLLSGAALALTWESIRRFAGVMGALVVVISVVVLEGYAFGSPVLYGGTVIPVALPTAFAFIFSGVAVVAAAGERVWPLSAFIGDTTRALLLRAFVPTIIGMMIVDALLRARLFAYFTNNPALIAAISTITMALLVIWVVSVVSRKVGARIDAAEQERNAARADLLALNAHLENRVRDRTRELSERHEQMGEELRMARELQFALLPHEYPIISGQDGAESALDFLSFFFPSGDVSGDFFTVFPLGENAAGIIICDVMGHGVRAALITGMVRVLVEEHAQTVSDPGELLTRINHGLTGILKQAGATMFATCFYLVADVEKRELRYANAGHPEPLRIRQRSGHSSVEWLPRSRTSGPAMGLFAQAQYRTHTSPMSPGDFIILYTDGLFEVENEEGDMMAQEDLLKIAQTHAHLPAEEVLASLVNDVRKLSPTDSFADDVCVVGVQVKTEAFATGMSSKEPAAALA